MKQSFNKFLLSEEQKIKQEHRNPQCSSIRGNKDIREIRQQMKDELMIQQQKDQELKKITDDLYIQAISSKKHLSQPMCFQQILKHQQQYENEKIIKEHDRQNRNKSTPKIDFYQSNAYLRVMQDQVKEQQERIYQQQSRKMRRYLQLRYSEIVNSLQIRPVAKSVHEKSSNAIVTNQLKSKAISMHQESEMNEQINLPMKQVDSYLINKLEKILKSETDQIPETKIKPRIQHNKHRSFHILQPIACKSPPVQKKSVRIPIHRKPDILPDQWKSIFDDSSISQHDRIQQTMEQLKLLNCQAIKLEEQTATQNNLEKECKLNDLLINQIQARLALLDNFK